MVIVVSDWFFMINCGVSRWVDEWWKVLFVLENLWKSIGLVTTHVADIAKIFENVLHTFILKILVLHIFIWKCVTYFYLKIVYIGLITIFWKIVLVW